MLNLAHVQVTEGANGPGRRFTVWVQGCARGCNGCFNPDLQPRAPRRRVSPEALAAELRRCGPVEGVSLSGGEPFDQAGGLADFLGLLRAGGPLDDFTALAFTGYCVEELREGDPDRRRLLGHLDLLVDGPYVEQASTVLPLRGSTNQRLVPLTPAGEDLVRRIEAEPPAACAAVIAEDGGVILTGFPPASAVRALRTALGD
ncbi:MAG: radical SAM protein [Deltaproteobacteria bacterium]|nr:radical SAM protein [Deltaproteobacteria bacterium]